MRKTLIALTVALVGSIFSSSAQTDNPEIMPDMRTRDIVMLGIQAHDREHYDSAITMFNWVHPNDTNYSWAVAEKANTLLAQEKYEDVINLCEAELAKPNGHAGSLFMSLGTAYDETEQSDKAIEAYERGIQIAPVLVRLHFNKAVTHVRREEYQQAYACLQRSLTLNPYHSSSHFLLGMLALQQGSMVPGALATSTFLMLEPGTQRSFDALVTLNNSLTEKTDLQEHGIDFGNDFRKTELLVENYAALRKGYKVPSDLDINAIKQIHLILKQVKLGKDDFISNYYGNFYKEIIADDKMFEGFSYLILIPSKSEQHQKVIEKNINDVKKFASWADDKWDALHMYGMDTLNGETQEVRYIRYDDHDIQGIGVWDKTTDKPIGTLRIYDQNGTLGTLGKFNTKGEREGDWKWYYANGVLKETQTYKDGEPVGLGTFYDMEGYAETEQDYNNGKRDGKRKSYFATGQEMFVSTYTDGEFSGPYQSYFPQGQIKFETVVKEGQQNGTGTAYFTNGKVDSKVNYEEGKRQGEYRAYFSNGQVAEESFYKDDLGEGDYKTYYRDGQLRLTGVLVEGNRALKWSAYNPDGTLDYEEEYGEDGKMTGTYKDYHFEGTIYHEVDYKKGEIQAYRYYDLEGNVIAEQKAKRGKLNFTAYHPNRVISAKGVLEDGEKEGKWTYYNEYGTLASIEEYSQGKSEGEDLEYFKDGTFKSVTKFKDGLRNGLYLEFFPDSSLYSQGRYVNNVQQGPWFYYNPDGTFKAALHIANGELEGWQRYYTKTGQLYRENYVRKGLLLAYRFFGPAGDTLADETLKGGTGTVQWKYPNGQTAYEANVVKGEYHGKITTYYPTGQVRYEGEYAFDNSSGSWTWYYLNGQVETTGEFVEDERTGTWYWYHENGKKSTITNYKYGKRDGVRKDYDQEGNLNSMSTYLADELHGKRYGFGEDSTIALVRTYRYGVVTSYTYLDENGELKPETPIVEGNAEIKTYYPNGKLAYDFAYKGGRYEGAFKRYYANGNLMHQSISKGGRDVGELKNYYSNGKVEDEYENVMGYEVGTSNAYHLNGKLKRKQEMAYGEREGKALVYDEKGELVRTEIWFNNTIYSIE